MISAYIHDGVLHLVACGSKDSAEIANWIDSDQPVIHYNELWVAPAVEYYEEQSQPKMSALTQHIRKVHDSLVSC